MKYGEHWRVENYNHDITIVVFVRVTALPEVIRVSIRARYSHLEICKLDGKIR